MKAHSVRPRRRLVRLAIPLLLASALPRVSFANELVPVKACAVAVTGQGSLTIDGQALSLDRYGNVLPAKAEAVVPFWKRVFRKKQSAAPELPPQKSPLDAEYFLEQFESELTALVSTNKTTYAQLSELGTRLFSAEDIGTGDEYYFLRTDGDSTSNFSDETPFLIFSIRERAMFHDQQNNRGAINHVRVNFYGQQTTRVTSSKSLGAISPGSRFTADPRIFRQTFRVTGQREKFLLVLEVQEPRASSPNAPTMGSRPTILIQEDTAPHLRSVKAIRDLYRNQGE